jgi:hypothetical protein
MPLKSNKSLQVQNASESKQVQRARRKIEERLILERAKFTPESLQVATQLIHQWLARHDQERISLKDRTIYTDASSSKNRAIINLMHKLQGQKSVKTSKKKLEGRISASSIAADQKGLSSSKKVKAKSK